MILRRIVESLKRHHWVTVAVELALVVLGVFIGIQVSNWNDTRKEHALGAVYLARIADDVRGDVAEMEEVLRVATVRMSVLDHVLRKAGGRDLPTGFDSARGRIEIEEFPEYSEAAGPSAGFALFILTTLEGNRSAYETVINTGGIGVIRDAVMLRRIQDYYASVDRALHYEVILEQNRDKLVDAQRKLGISPVSAMSADDHSAAIAANPELRATAENYWLYTNRQIKLIRDLQRQARALAEKLQPT